MAQQMQLRTVLSTWAADRDEDQMLFRTVVITPLLDIRATTRPGVACDGLQVLLH